MSFAIANTGGFMNTRRWPRYHVYLPVFIATEADVFKMSVPGLVSEISRSGMALYGGVQLQPGDLMEVEFQTSAKLRIAGVVRSRAGYCFGLEFLNPKTNSQMSTHYEPTGNLPTYSSRWSPFATRNVETARDSNAILRADAVRLQRTLAELVRQSQEVYLHDKELEIDRLRQKALKIRQLRREIESLVRGRYNQ
jgi:PilZ domain